MLAFYRPSSSRTEHRNAEINTLKPIMDGHSGDLSLLLGPSGAGKTCIARFTVERSRDILDINMQYINCWQAYARFQVLYQLPQFTKILITNRERDLFIQLDDRLTSHLHLSVRISFEKDHLDEFVSILIAPGWGSWVVPLNRPRSS